MGEVHVGDRVLAVVRGDLTTFAADALVNAANSALAGGGGVDGAIHRAGGPSIMAELREHHGGGTPTGTAVVTGAGGLPARWVIHAVGPIWRGGGHGEADLLASAYRASMTHARRLGAGTIALPAISCGVYGYPVTQAAQVAVETVADELAAESSVVRATFVVYSPDMLDVFEDALDRLPEALSRLP